MAVARAILSAWSASAVVPAFSCAAAFPRRLRWKNSSPISRGQDGANLQRAQHVVE